MLDIRSNSDQEGSTIFRIFVLVQTKGILLYSGYAFLSRPRGFYYIPDIRFNSDQGVYYIPDICLYSDQGVLLYLGYQFLFRPGGSTYSGYQFLFRPGGSCFFSQE